LHDLVPVSRLFGEKQERRRADVSPVRLVAAVPSRPAERRPGEVMRSGLPVRAVPVALMPRSTFTTRKITLVHNKTPISLASRYVYHDIS
jgi:hypothetical protein